jgi:hypothetical protein
MFVAVFCMSVVAGSLSGGRYALLMIAFGYRLATWRRERRRRNAAL